MRTRSILAFAVSLVMAAAVLAQAAETEKKAPAENGEKKMSAGKSAASRLVKIPAADVKWTDLDPKGAPGVQIADVWGNHAKGAFGAFLKFPAGFAAPLHTHTNDYKVVILSGTFIQGPEGGAEFRLGPGSYFLQPGGNYKHTTACDKASDCVIFFQSTGKFDLKVVEPPKASEPAKK
jgi:anti-sigma factor ChrR (cupin superfamily)